MKPTRVLLTVSSLAACVTIFIFFSSRVSESSLFGAFEGAGKAQPLLTAIVGFAVTLVGVVFGSVYRRLLEMKEAGRRTVKIRTLLPQVFMSIDFMIGLVASPIVFGLLWQSLENLPVSGLVVICLQNGFACNSVIGTFIGGNEGDE